MIVTSNGKINSDINNTPFPSRNWDIVTSLLYQNFSKIDKNHKT